MKILHIITGLGRGGAEKTLRLLVRSSPDHDHIVVSLLDAGIYGKLLKRDGIRLIVLNLPKGKARIGAVVELVRILRKERPDMVQSWLYHADLLAGLSVLFSSIRVPVVWGIRGPFNRQLTSLQTKIVIYCCALLSRTIPNAIVANSFYAMKSHIRAGYSSQKMQVIHNGYDKLNAEEGNKSSIKIRKELGIADNIPLLGMVARFDPYKDHQSLFLALQELVHEGVEFECLLVGDGLEESNKEIVDILERLEIKPVVKLMGPVNNIHKIFSALDLHILSSADESFPNVLAESMLCETPCVATDVGDARLIIGNTGWLVPAGQPPKLAHDIKLAIEEMNDSEKWSKRCQSCEHRVLENFGMNKMLRAYEELWTQFNRRSKVS